MAKYDRAALTLLSRLCVIAMVLLVLVILSAVLSRSAHAGTMLSPLFGSALGDVKTNISVMGGLIVGVVVAAQSFVWIRRVLRSPQSIDPDFVDEFEHVEDRLLEFPDLTAYELAGENEDADHSEIDYETRMAMASWEEGYEAQVLRQDGAEYSPYEFVGSEFRVDVESAKQQEADDLKADLAVLGFDDEWEAAHEGQIKDGS